MKQEAGNVKTFQKLPRWFGLSVAEIPREGAARLREESTDLVRATRQGHDFHKAQSFVTHETRVGDLCG